MEMISSASPNGLDLNLKGAPDHDCVDLPEPATLALLPERIPFFKPRLLVAEEDTVRCGTPLIADKRNPEVTLASPAGGRIAAIRLGPRRVIREIVIERDSSEKFVEIEPVPAEKLGALNFQDLTARLMVGGLWPLMRQLPFRDYARPDQAPRIIVVVLDSREPFQPSPQVYLDGRQELFDYGMQLLGQLGAQRIEVSLSGDPQRLDESIRGHISYHCPGKYPAGDPGVTLYRTRNSPADNRAWYISGQDLLLWAEFLRSGRFAIRRVVTLGGNIAQGRRHYRTRLGVPLAHLMGQSEVPRDQRYVVGGIFRGYRAEPDSHLGLLESSLTMVDDGHHEEFLALFNPGPQKLTFSRLFVSRLTSRPLAVDCNMHGGERACIACMHCADVCPVDILPQLAYKAILVEEVEEYLAHGLLDCVECGLCSYVCPSKIELTAVIKSAKADYLADYDWKSD